MSSVTPVTKRGFVAEVLGKDPDADLDAVVRAWQGAGNGDTISPATYSLVKRELKDNPAPAPPANGRIDFRRNGPAEGTLREMRALERDLDEMVYRAMHGAGMEDVADALRSARRVLILAQHP